MSLSPEQLYEVARWALEEGEANVALLLFQQAGNQDHTPSMLAIGQMYDPRTFDPARSAFDDANALLALDWYYQAFLAGDPSAEDQILGLANWLAERAATDPSAAQVLRQFLSDPLIRSDIPNLPPSP